MFIYFTILKRMNHLQFQCNLDWHSPLRLEETSCIWIWTSSDQSTGTTCINSLLCPYVYEAQLPSSIVMVVTWAECIRFFLESFSTIIFKSFNTWTLATKPHRFMDSAKTVEWPINHYTVVIRSLNLFYGTILSFLGKSSLI